MAGDAPTYDELARRVRELSERLDAMEERAPVTRRTMLRSAATTSATAVAGVVAGAMFASTPVAHAASGDPLVLGQTNSSGTHGTKISGNTTDPLLQITANGTGDAIYGASAGGGSAVVGYVSTPTSADSAVYGSTAGTGVGVEGRSNNGRGGKFTGRFAQINLAPGTSTTHPSHGGILGDLYVDLNARLWFCRGANNWVQVV